MGKRHGANEARCQLDLSFGKRSGPPRVVDATIGGTNVSKNLRASINKVMRKEALKGLRLRCVGFDIEPELTARLLRAGRRIVEVPISYNPRTADEGKKMRWIDGVDAVYTLFKCRFTP